jgi:hypothetical protein
MFKRRSPTSSLITPGDEWISLSLEMASKLTNSTHIDMVHQALTVTTYTMMMVAQEKTKSYIERALGNDFIPFAIEMYVFIFILIHFLPLMHDHYCASLMVFFGPFDACLLLLITHVHNPTTCISHSDFLTTYYI